MPNFGKFDFQMTKGHYDTSYYIAMSEKCKMYTDCSGNILNKNLLTWHVTFRVRCCFDLMSEWEEYETLAVFLSFKGSSHINSTCAHSGADEIPLKFSSPIQVIVHFKIQFK